MFVSYTYSKSIDQSSNLGDQVDPFDPNLSRGLSSFDMRQNFVASYTYKLPFERSSARTSVGPKAGRFLESRAYSTGLPVTFYNYEDTSLLGTQGNGINNLAVDELEYTHGPARSESQSAQRKPVLQYLAVQFAAARIGRATAAGGCSPGRESITTI